MRRDEGVRDRPEHKHQQLALEQQAEKHHCSEAEKKHKSRKSVADAVCDTVGIAVAVAAAAVSAATAVAVAVAVPVAVALAEH